MFVHKNKMVQNAKLPSPPLEVSNKAELSLEILG